jgi:hypothetical protein
MVLDIDDIAIYLMLDMATPTNPRYTLHVDHDETIE